MFSFRMQEALKRELGELDFRRAKWRKKIPTVLTTGECQRLFAQLSDTTRLMAELMWLTDGLARKYARAGESWVWQWLFPSREARW